MPRKKEEKRLVKVDIPSLYIDTDIFEGELNEISKNIKNLPNQLKELVEKYHYPPQDLDKVEVYKLKTSLDWDDNIKLNLVGYRWETDDEFKERIKKQKEANKKHKETMLLRNKQKEVEDRKLYEELKKRFGDV